MFEFMNHGQVGLKDLQKAIKELPLPEKIKCVAIYKRYKQIRKVEEQMRQAIKKIQKKYLQLDQPVLRKTAQVVSGKKALNLEDIIQPEKYLTQEQIPKIGQNLEAKKIPFYWRKCLNGSPMVKNSMGPDDEKLLDHIQDIRVVDQQGTDNFTIVFEFSQNQYITNPKLQKKFYIKNDQPVKCQASVIQWKGKNLTQKQVKKKQKNKKTGQQRVVTKTVDSKSFFTFFRNIEGINPNINPLEADDEQIALRQKLDDDFQIGGIIVDEILPYSLEYYLQIKHQEEDNQFDDEIDQDSDNDDQDDKKDRKKKSKSKSKSKGKKKQQSKQAPKAAEKPQCKQQ